MAQFQSTEIKPPSLMEKKSSFLVPSFAESNGDLGDSGDPARYLQTLPALSASFTSQCSLSQFTGFSVPSTFEDDGILLTRFLDVLEVSPEERAKLEQINTALFAQTDWVTDPVSKNITAASFNQLILFLTSPNAANMDFQEKFLITFPSFSTPSSVMAALLVRYFPDLNQPLCNIRQNTLKPIRDRIIRIITTWTSRAPYQFARPESQNLIECLKQFAKYLEGVPGKDKTAMVINASINSLSGVEMVKKYTPKGQIPDTLPLPPGDPSTWKLIDIEPVELARQVTQFSFEAFLKIGPMELLTAIWGAKKGGGAPNLDILTSHFDVFSRYCSQTVIEPQNPKDRANVYRYWVEVAHEFLEHQNFHGMFAVMSGLTHVSVTRLKQTFKSIKYFYFSGKAKKMYQELLNISDFGNNYQNYRDYIETPHHPRILFLGAFQKDLIYVQEQFPNKVGELINFRKCDECMKLIKTINGCQNERFFYHEVPAIQTILKNMTVALETTGLMKLSMEREAKKK